MIYAYQKCGWAILETFSDGSSGFANAKGTLFPKIWAQWDRAGAVLEMKNLPPGAHRPKRRTVKVKVTWPEIL